jgi:hypothetical protein
MPGLLTDSRLTAGIPGEQGCEEGTQPVAVGAFSNHGAEKGEQTGQATHVMGRLNCNSEG